jgi:hypothetical protein
MCEGVGWPQTILVNYVLLRLLGMSHGGGGRDAGNGAILLAPCQLMCAEVTQSPAKAYT